MTEPRTKYPIESFGPELMAALLKGGREKLILRFPGTDGKRTAHNLQRRIHTLRSRMRQMNHPQYMLAARARVSLFWGDKAVREGNAPEDWADDYDGKRGAILVLRPHDSEFAGVLRDAGVTVEVPAELPSEPTDAPSGIDSLLDELQQKQTSSE